MCGLFGYVGTPLNNVNKLRQIAEHTEFLRGGHAFGWAWLDADRKLHTFKASGAICQNYDLVGMLEGAVAIIGHCRFATHGLPSNNVNNHPHPSGSGWIAHNGIVHEYRELAKKFRLSMSSDCDSEVLARMVERFKGSYQVRLRATCRMVSSPCAILGLWGNRVYVARYGNPLHHSECQEGVYFASLAASLSDTPREFRDNYVSILEVKHVPNRRTKNRNDRRQLDADRTAVARTAKKGWKVPNLVRRGASHDGLLF